MTIKYIKSDLFSTLDDYIAHGVNCIGVMGAGVARTIKEKYPKAYEDYVEFCRGKNKPGLLGLVKASVQPDGKVILNCFTQEMYGRDGRRQVSYDAVDRCMISINDSLKMKDFFTGVYKECPTSISMPKIGAGLGGGCWEVIEQIINHRLGFHNINVYCL